MTATTLTDRYVGTNYLVGTYQPTTLLSGIQLDGNDPAERVKAVVSEFYNLRSVRFPNDLVLHVGVLEAFPEDTRGDVLEFPLDCYRRLGYIDPSQLGSLEQYPSDFSRTDIHIVVMALGEILANLNLVTRPVITHIDQLLPEDFLPTQQLFNIGFPSDVGSTPAALFAEPSRLTKLTPSQLGDIKKYDLEKYNVLRQLLDPATYVLGWGIGEVTRLLGSAYWILNYVPSKAGAFASRVSGGFMFEPISVDIKQEAYSGPFGPYFTTHKDSEPVQVTVAPAQIFGGAMKVHCQEALSKSLVE